MSSGPFPGQPQDPWQGSGPPPADDPYPWGGAPVSSTPVPYDASTSYPATSSVGPGPAETWESPVERRRGGGNGLAIAVIAGLALLVCGGGPLAYYLVSRDTNSTSQAQHGPSRPAATAPATTAAPTPEPTTPRPTATGGGSGSDVFSVRIGDCLANEGTDSAPKMRAAKCGPDTYEVLKRIPGTTSRNRCDGVPGYTHNYFYDSTTDDKDFVLCLKRR
jgi:hypothetical protein